MDIEEFFRDDWGLGRETIDATKGFITTASQAFPEAVARANQLRLAAFYRPQSVDQFLRSLNQCLTSGNSSLTGC